MHVMTAPVARPKALRKTILCGAVAGALLLPTLASATGHSIYGDLRYSPNSVDDESTAYDPTPSRTTPRASA